MSGDRIRQLAVKARESLRAADGLFRDNHPDVSASRAYYSMFYLVEALLLTRDLKFKKHTGVIGAFNREFIKTKIFGYAVHAPWSGHRLKRPYQQLPGIVFVIGTRIIVT